MVYNKLGNLTEIKLDYKNHIVAYDEELNIIISGQQEKFMISVNEKYID